MGDLNKERVSVVIPVYNAGKKLKACLNSVLKQSYPYWNLVAVDDGSTDGSSRVLDDFASRDSRIQVIHQPNAGSVAARRNGVMTAKENGNRWLTFCDADDELKPNALQTLMEVAQKYQVDMVVADLDRKIGPLVMPNSYKSPCFKISSPQVYTHQEVIDKLMISFFGVTNLPPNLFCKLFKIDQIESAINQPAVVKFMVDDLTVSIKAVLAAQSIAITPAIIYNYNMGGGTSKYMPYLMDDFLRLFRYKWPIAESISMPLNWRYYMYTEILNMMRAHLMQSLNVGGLSDETVLQEISNLCEVEEISAAADYYESYPNKKLYPYACLVRNRDYAAILADVKEELHQMRFRNAAVKASKKVVVFLEKLNLI